MQKVACCFWTCHPEIQLWIAHQVPPEPYKHELVTAFTVSRRKLTLWFADQPTEVRAATWSKFSMVQTFASLTAREGTYEDKTIN